MNKAVLTKHKIYNKLFGFTEHDLDAVANFIDFMRHTKKLEAKKVIKLEGILKGHDIDIADLKEFKQQTWKHVDQEFAMDSFVTETARYLDLPIITNDPVSVH